MSFLSHANRHAAAALRYACFRSTLLDVAIATEYNMPAFFAVGADVASVRNSAADRLVFFPDGFLSAPTALIAEIAHRIISIAFIVVFLLLCPSSPSKLALRLVNRKGRETKPPPMHRMRRLREPGMIHRRRRNCTDGQCPLRASFQ